MGVQNEFVTIYCTVDAIVREYISFLSRFFQGIFYCRTFLYAIKFIGKSFGIFRIFLKFLKIKYVTRCNYHHVPKGIFPIYKHNIGNSNELDACVGHFVTRSTWGWCETLILWSVGVGRRLQPHYFFGGQKQRAIQSSDNGKILTRHK